MAYRPSKRAKQDYEWVQPNITPMMNLMVVLIPLLLSTAEFVRLGVIEINLPPGESSAELFADTQQNNLDLAITITDKGFFISSNIAVLAGTDEGKPTVPILGVQNDSLIYDYSTLSMRLYEVKCRLREVIRQRRDKTLFPDSLQIILTAEPNVIYQTVVSTMDAARAITIDNQEILLFDHVSLSPGIF